MPAVTIGFVGQCHTVGYPGVPPDAAFPCVCRQAIQERRPAVRVELFVKEYYHPSELPDAVEDALRRSPRVIVVEVVGWLTVRGREAVDLSTLPPGVRSAYQRVRHLRQMSRQMLSGVPKGPDLVYAVHKRSAAWARQVLGSLVTRYPRSSVDDYEHFVTEALEVIKNHPNVHGVIQGPGAPNLDVGARSLPPDMLDRYRDVASMARRVAQSQDALYVDRWDTVSPGFFSPGTVRPSAQGHSAWGQILAAELLSAGLV
jgi:hypothetical protein